MPIIPVKDVGAIGVASDVPATDLPANAWTDALNVRFRDGTAERFYGETQIFSAPSVTPYYVTPFQTNTSKYWIHAGTAAIYADDGTTRTNITGTAPTGAATNRWTGGTLNGVLVMNNGVDAPMYWGGTGTLASLTGWSANWKAASIRPFKNYLIALNLTKTGVNYPHMVKWSSAADPGTIPTSWDEADPTIDAGEVDLAETPDIIVDGLSMGDAFIVYKQRSMYSLTYAGQPYIFRFQRLPGEHGALARGCVANFPNGHIVLTAGDVVVHQGMGAQSILTGKMRKWLFTNIDSTNYANAFVTTNPWRNEAWICFPEAGNTYCTKALVWNWNDNTFAIRTLNNVTYGAPGQIDYTNFTTDWSDTDPWESDVTGWDTNEFSAAESRLVLSTTAPKIVAVDTGVTFSGTLVQASLERTDLAFDMPYKVKTVKAIYPRIEGSAGMEISVQVGSSMDSNASVSWSSPVTYTVGSTYKIDTFTSGRFLAVRFTSSSYQPWRIRSYELDVSLHGDY